MNRAEHKATDSDAGNRIKPSLFALYLYFFLRFPHFQNKVRLYSKDFE